MLCLSCTGSLLFLFPPHLDDRLDDNPEATERAAENDTNSGSKKGGQANRLDIPPRYEAREKIRGQLA